MKGQGSGTRRAIAAAFVLASLLVGAAPAAAEARRPPAAALIAAAKATQLDAFQVREELRGLTVERWLKQLFGARPIAWRATSCRSSADGKTMTASPICVEASVRFAAGVAFTLGVGFDEKAARPQDKPNAIWGTIAIRGKPCDFLRHPDQIHEARPQIDEMVKAGGRCQ
jgi:hypothetical protein